MVSGFRALRRAKTSLRSPKILSKTLQGASKTPQRSAKTLLRGTKVLLGLSKNAFSFRTTPQLKVTVKVNWNAGIPLDWIRLKLIGAGGIREAIRILTNSLFLSFGVSGPGTLTI